MQTSSEEISLLETYIETISSFNTEQDSFGNIEQAILQYNVSKCSKYYISSDVKGDSHNYTLGVWILLAP